jgi:hypothetical protein
MRTVCCGWNSEQVWVPYSSSYYINIKQGTQTVKSVVFRWRCNVFIITAALKWSTRVCLWKWNLWKNFRVVSIVLNNFVSISKECLPITHPLLKDVWSHLNLSSQILPPPICCSSEALQSMMAISPCWDLSDFLDFCLFILFMIISFVFCIFSDRYNILLTVSGLKIACFFPCEWCIVPILRWSAGFDRKFPSYGTESDTF